MLNPNYGKHHTEETKEKMRKAKEGKYCGSANPNYGKHHIPWNKNKSWSDEVKDKIRKTLIGKFAGEKNPMWGKSAWIGKKHSEETKIKMSENRKRKIKNGEIVYPKGKDNPFYGKKHSELTKEKIGKASKARSEQIAKTLSKANKGRIPWNKGLAPQNDSRILVGEKNPAWKGGKSFEPYSPEFNKQLKELIRSRDGYKCQLCSCPEIEEGKKLSIHHIDYDKKNCLPSNLITLCDRCNKKVNSNRKKWTCYFRGKITRKKNFDSKNIQLCLHK